MEKYDLVLTNAKIVDGTGNPWFRADVGIRDGRIAHIGRIDPAAGEHSADLGGKVLAPGFIDGHCHADFAVFGDPVIPHQLRQGVTTTVIGNCGISAAPVSAEYLGLLQRYVAFTTAGVSLDWVWTSFDSYLHRLEALPLAINVAAYVGHGTVRLAVMGMEGRTPTAAELTAMEELTAEAMAAGAVGLSSGLIYPPGVYSETEEVVALARVVSEWGGVYASHMRSEASEVLKSVEETIRVAREAGIPAIISHHKVSGRPNWGRSSDTLRRIEAARAEGLDIVFDQYPYIAGNTTLSAILPPWAQIGGVEQVLANLRDPAKRARIGDEIENHRGGWESMVPNCGWDGIVVLYAPQRPEIAGLSISEIAARQGKSPLDAALDTILEQEGVASALYFTMDEADVQAILRHRAGMVGSDGIPMPTGMKAHPRLHGTFPRVLGHYGRDLGLLTLEEAVRKMTSFPARCFGMARKGLVAVGMDADLVVFDPAAIKDEATFADSARPPRGIEAVYVGGRLALAEGAFTGVRAGRVLRRGH